MLRRRVEPAALERTRLRGRPPARAALGVVLAVWAALFAFGQTGATGGDEDLHIVAAMRVAAGQRPYLDFFHQHPPLFAYVGAAWFRAFGTGWRSAHALAALMTGAAVLVTTAIAGTRLGDTSGRSAVAAAILVGLHSTTLTAGTIGHPYALTVLLLVAAYGLTLLAGEQPTWIRAGGAGLCAGAAAASSLLAVPGLLVLLAWLLLTMRGDERLRAGTGFAAGMVVSVVPVLALAVREPRVVAFDLVGFHLLHRSVAAAWTPSRTEWFLWNPHVLLETWVDAPQGLFLLILALVGVAHWDPGRRRPALTLAAWLVAGLGIYAACIVPTNYRYFIAALPFIGLLAANGVDRLLSGVAHARRRKVLLVALLGLFLAGLVRPIYREFKHVEETSMTAQHYRWTHWERVAEEVNRVSPPEALVLAPIWVYVAAKRLPPPGLGNRYGQRLAAASEPALARRGPVGPIDEWLALGRFDTVVLHSLDPEFSLTANLYPRHRQVLTYHVFWGRAPTTH